MTRQTTCGEALVRLLERRGVDTVFGIPGVHTLDLYRGLAASNIRHVLVRHEQGAGFMADGYARTSGRPGVCFVITGPGVTNIATPMGQAYSDSIPMLVISTVRATADLGDNFGRLHEITDQRSATAPLTAFSATAMSPDEVPELINRAFEVFDSARPRPVHIEIPLDVAAMPVDGDWTPADASRPAAPSVETLSAAASVLGDAETPVIIAGGGAIECAVQLPRLAEILGAPVITTVAGKGLMPADHPLNLGATLPRAETQEIIGQADAVLAIGTELAETDTWVERLPLKGRLVRCDIDPDQINAAYTADATVLGDAVAALDGIIEQLAGQRANDRSGAEDQVRAARQALADSETELARGHRRVLDVLAAALPDDAAVYTDMTQIAYTGNEIYDAPRPRSWFHPNGYGTLGYALPAAIGGKLANPGMPAVALAGDFGFQFTVQDLIVAAELGLHMTVMVWNNDALGQIRDDMIDKGIDKVGVEGRNPDFRLLAEAYGANYLQPTGPEGLAADLARSLSEPGLWFMEIRQSDFVPAPERL